MGSKRLVGRAGNHWNHSIGVGQNFWTYQQSSSDKITGNPSLFAVGALREAVSRHGNHGYTMAKNAYAAAALAVMLKDKSLPAR